MDLHTAYWAGKKMSGKRWKESCSIFCRPFFCRFLLAAALLAAAQFKLGRVSSNQTATLVMKGVRR